MSDPTPCPFCPDGHNTRQPWSVYVAPARDGDGQPTHLIVAPSAGAHVAESDAEAIRRILNHPRTVPRP